MKSKVFLREFELPPRQPQKNSYVSIKPVVRGAFRMHLVDCSFSSYSIPLFTIAQFHFSLLDMRGSMLRDG
jgi:hypothetical protein